MSVGHSHFVRFPTLILILILLLLVGCQQLGSQDAVPTPTSKKPGTSPKHQPDIAQAESPVLSALEESVSLRFKHIPPDQGLSQSVVQDIIQDDQGFLWLGTQDGLNRFDGYEFKVFKSDPRSDNSLRGNLVSSLAKDSTGMIWIGTSDGGLNRYDPTTGTFQHFTHDPEDPNSLSENSVADLLVAEDGKLWIGTSNQGLNVLDPQTGEFSRYLHDSQDPSSLSSNVIFRLAQHPDGSIWIATTSGGLNRLNPDTGKFTRYSHDPEDPTSLGEDGVQSVHVDRTGTLWVGTYSAGLHRYDPSTDSFVRFPVDPQDQTSLASPSVSDIFEDSRGNLWVATNGGGLNVLDRKTQTFTRYLHNSFNPESLSGDYLMKVFEDRDKTLWLGMFGTGLDYYDPLSSQFVLARSIPGVENALNSSEIWSIFEDAQGNLYVGTQGGGLNHFDSHTSKWTSFESNLDQEGSLNGNIVYAIYQDESGLIWLGTDTGIEKYDPQSGQFTQYPNSFVFDIIEDAFGEMWFATALGLIRTPVDELEMFYEKNPGEIFPKTYTNDPGDPKSISGDIVLTVIEDSEQDIWVGTYNAGLSRFDRQTGTFTRFLHDDTDPGSLSANTVISIYQASDDTLWIGTTTGLNRYDAQSGTFKIYNQEDGLPSDTIYGILEDDTGNLWLSTNWGISRFDVKGKTFRNFNKTDGLQDSEFNQGAYFRGPSGLMYFGGLNGLNAFQPGSILELGTFPPVVLTGLKIFNKPVMVGEDSPLQRPLEVSQEIKLDHTDDFFEFTYAALYPAAPDEIEYAYQMDGLDQGWNEVGRRRFATYTNVPPGEYVFRVKSTNRDGVWSEEDNRLAVNIPPPFWQTVWFRLLVVLGAAALVVFWVWNRIRSIENQRRLLEVQVEQRTNDLQETMVELEHAKTRAEAANQAKSAFLANMSHEFRTPLNAILGFTQILRRDSRLVPDQKEDIAIINRSSEHLLGLINDVLDMSKIEAGHANLNRRTFDLHRMLMGLGEMFALRAEYKGIALEVEIGNQVPQYIIHDEGKLRQVLMNLLGNAVKFTEQGHIRLRTTPASPLSQNDPDKLWLSFSVEDTGIGIEPGEIEKIFNPFEQAQAGQTLHEGTGLGLSISQQFVRLMGGEISVSSQPGSGSIFSFILPVDPASTIDVQDITREHPVIGLKPGHSEFRILVVDDNEANRRLIKQLLSPLGFTVCEAENGQQAINLWDEWEPHLIFMDMRMPIMDGYAATRHIKSTTRGMATVIIALTASALEEDRVVILSEGCDDYIRKPFQEKEVFDALTRHLGVQFIYADEPSQATGETIESKLQVGQSVIIDQRLVERLALINPDLLENLSRAAVLGDLTQIDLFIEQIRQVDPETGVELAGLANIFNHEQILFLVHDAKEMAKRSDEL